MTVHPRTAGPPSPDLAAPSSALPCNSESGSDDAASQVASSGVFTNARAKARVADGVDEGEIVGPAGWKRRLEDPLNTYYRYPLALLMVRGLVKTSITPNQISFAQPLLAAVAGFLVTYDDWRHHVLAVAAFELRSILDCVDGSLARAKRMSSPYGHAIDAMADWLGVTFLYVGILMHFRMHPPTSWTGVVGATNAPTLVATTMVIVLASTQAAIRSFSFDYFKTKYLSIYEAGRDASIEGLRAKVLANQKTPSLFGHIDIFIGRFGHLVFEREWFDPETSRAALSEQEIATMSRGQESPRAKRMGFWWSISGGDAFLSFVMLSILAGQLWAGQVFFATLGIVWIVSVIVYNIHFVRVARREDLPPIEARS